jgi:hypothetical protein
MGRRGSPEGGGAPRRRAASRCGMAVKRVAWRFVEEWYTWPVPVGGAAGPENYRSSPMMGKFTVAFVADGVMALELFSTMP